MFRVHHAQVLVRKLESSLRKLWIIGIPIALLLAACGGPEPTTQADRAMIERCWQNAGISGDLYKFITPAQAGGLQAGGVVSEAQAVSFKQCIGS